MLTIYTHVNNKYEIYSLNRSYVGLMIIIVALDGNHDKVLLAFGLGIIESEGGWTWFLWRLNECLGAVAKLHSQAICQIS